MGLISCNANPDAEVIQIQFAGVVAEIALSMGESKRLRAQLELAEKRLYNQLAAKRVRAWHDAQGESDPRA